jgi:hypothetical protein
MKTTIGLVFMMIAGLVLCFAATGCISRFPSHTVHSVCWGKEDASGARFAHYSSDKYGAVNEHCKAPEKFSWPKKIKTVAMRSGTEYDDFYDSFKEAVKFWNNEMDQEVFRIESNPEAADIVIVFDTFQKEFGEEDPVGASTRIFKVGEELHAEIHIKSFMDIRQMYLTMAHELGHAGFGLAHDRHGIMLPNVADAEGDKMMFWPVLNDDKEAIKQMLASQ